MYKSFFGLRENPFNVNPGPRYLFRTHVIEEALAGLTYGIQTRKGFLLLTGEVGTGKTTLLNKLLNRLHRQRVATAFILHTLINAFVDQQKPVPADLVDEVAREFLLDQIEPTVPPGTAAPKETSPAIESLIRDLKQFLDRLREPSPVPAESGERKP